MYEALNSNQNIQTPVQRYVNIFVCKQSLILISSVLEPGVLGEDYMYNRKKVGVCTLCKVDMC